VMTTYNVNGKVTASYNLADATPHTNMLETEEQAAIAFWWHTFRADPFHHGRYLGIITGKYAAQIYSIDPTKRQIRFITNSDIEAWSPDGQSFITCAYLNLAPYGDGKQLYKSVLVKVNPKTFETKVLQGGLVVCSGVDWLHGKSISDEQEW
jgi:hypothetical protein